MFGLGRRRQNDAWQLFELIFFPDGDVIHQGWRDALPHGFEKPADGKIAGEFAIDGVACRLDATLRDGDAIFSMWADGKIITSSLLLSSDDPAFNASLTELYLESARSTNLVQQLTQGRAVFTELEGRSERPLLATLLMPAPSPQLTDRLLDTQRAWVGAILR
jgi:hypothetical protein